MAARRHGEIARQLGLGLTLAALAGCGGATGGDGATGDGTARGATTSGGDNEPRLTLRVRAAPGARYGTTTHVVTELGGAVVLTDAIGGLEVEAVDAAAHTLAIASMVRSMRQSDVEGHPIDAAIAHLDMSGVRFRRTIDERGAVLGHVEATGTTEVTAAFAETLRSTIEQSFVKLPEHPVRAGDTWEDRALLHVPVEGLVLDMTCDLVYRMTGTEGTGEQLAAHLEIEGGCEVPPTSVRDGFGSIAISSRTIGSQVVAVRDGLTGTFRMTSDTTTTIQISGETEPRVSLMRQETTVVTTPLAE